MLVLVLLLLLIEGISSTFPLNIMGWPADLLTNKVVLMHSISRSRSRTEAEAEAGPE